VIVAQSGGVANQTDQRCMTGCGFLAHAKCKDLVTSECIAIDSLSNEAFDARSGRSRPLITTVRSLLLLFGLLLLCCSGCSGCYTNIHVLWPPLGVVKKELVDEEEEVRRRWSKAQEDFTDDLRRKSLSHSNGMERLVCA
jgi:hypothetical protein